MRQNAKPMRILIVGGGTAGWMTAAGLAKLLPKGLAEIKLVESQQIGTVGVGEATVPHIRFFNAKLGIDENDFIRRTKATFKLGIEFCDWSRLGDSYIHPFGEYGKNIDGIPFHQHWLRAKNQGFAQDLEHYSLPILAAREDKFDFPAQDLASPLSTYSYAYQFDAGLYAQYLRDFSEALGVKRLEGRIIDTQLDGNTGFVKSVKLENGTELEADLFIDCSGFRGLLIEQALKTGYEDWTQWLPCDRAYAAPCETNGAMTPYSRATAKDAGWVWRIPLQHRVGNGHVYSSAFTTDEQALEDLVNQLESPPQSDPIKLFFKTGIRKKTWSKNVVSIGLSAGFLEPLESTSIMLIQIAIGYLLDMFPDHNFDPVNEMEFNRAMGLEYERVRDFLILHYHATERDDTEFWNYCRTMQIPDSLSDRMQLFKESGVVSHYKEGAFLDASWYAVFFGQNIYPQDYDPRADQISNEDLSKYMNVISNTYQQSAKTMSTHEFILQEVNQNRAVNNSVARMPGHAR